MSETPITEPLSFDDRLLLAQERLVLTYAERDNFLSDDDVLDAADEFTTSVRSDDEDADDYYADDSDYVRLRAALFAFVTADR